MYKHNTIIAHYVNFVNVVQNKQTKLVSLTNNTCLTCVKHTIIIKIQKVTCRNKTKKGEQHESLVITKDIIK